MDKEITTNFEDTENKITKTGNPVDDAEKNVDQIKDENVSFSKSEENNIDSNKSDWTSPENQNDEKPLITEKDTENIDYDKRKQEATKIIENIRKEMENELLKIQNIIDGYETKIEELQADLITIEKALGKETEEHKKTKQELEGQKFLNQKYKEDKKQIKKSLQHFLDHEEE